MSRIVIVAVILVCLAGAAHAVDDPCWRKYTFCQDLGIEPYVTPENSIHWWFPLDGPTIVPEGGYIAVQFCVTGYAHGSLSHSSLMGPLEMGSGNYYPTVRLNLHFTSANPEFSIYANGVSGLRYTLTVGKCYCANLIRSGSMAEVELYEVLDGGTFVGPIFTDALAADWPTFDRFLLGYDYYGGGYCIWDQPPCMVHLKCDRHTSYIEYDIHSVTLCDIGPTAVEPTTWGGVKSFYR